MKFLHNLTNIWKKRGTKNDTLFNTDTKKSHLFFAQNTFDGYTIIYERKQEETFLEFLKSYDKEQLYGTSYDNDDLF